MLVLYREARIIIKLTCAIHFVNLQLHCVGIPFRVSESHFVSLAIGSGMLIFIDVLVTVGIPGALGYELCRNRARIVTYRRSNFLQKKVLRLKPQFYSIKQDGLVRIPPSPVLGFELLPLLVAGRD